VVSSNNAPNFLPNMLDWTVNRQDRTFHVYVVEPGLYEPKTHSDIFEAAINMFIESRPKPIDPYARHASVDQPLRFDLVTFPEAFLPPEQLLGILGYIGRLDSFGCVHVGLRSSATDRNHLFPVPKLEELVEELRNVEGIVKTDLVAFEDWLSGQGRDARFNVGCLFTLDADQKVRVCLHPKMVQSKYEVSPLEEKNMEEANLLTVITLRPANKDLKTVIIQPLLCSDVLHLPTKRGGSRPLEALQRDAICLGDRPPDHVDIVSVATCTPQVLAPSSKAPRYRTWQDKFKETFERAASDDALGRHHFATFVLSNFQMLSAHEPGGLSGAFLPVSPGHDEFPKYVTLSCYGKPLRSNENRWSRPNEDCLTRGKWQARGYIAALSPFTGKPEAIARMFGFTVDKLPRDRSLWDSNRGLTVCTLDIGEFQGEPPLLQFARYSPQSVS
jgi:hypothetical protein